MSFQNHEHFSYPWKPADGSVESSTATYRLPRDHQNDLQDRLCRSCFLSCSHVRFLSTHSTARRKRQLTEDNYTRRKRNWFLTVLLCPRRLTAHLTGHPGPQCFSTSSTSLRSIPSLHHLPSFWEHASRSRSRLHFHNTIWAQKCWLESRAKKHILTKAIHMRDGGGWKVI